MAEAKKFVINVMDLHNEKDKKRVMKTVSALEGIDSVSVDMAKNKMTVVGNVDSVAVVQRLRKKGWCAHIDTLGPAKEPEKKKEEPKKEEPKMEDVIKAWGAYHQHNLIWQSSPCYDENPNNCGIM